MKLEKLKCRNFRNIKELELSSFEDMNVICGENAQGKTNIIEAIWLFTGAKSFRSSKDSAFVNFEADKAIINIEFSAFGVKNEASIEIDEHRKAEINGIKQKSASSIAGNFNAVIFSPVDLTIVSDGPAERRRFLDTAIGQLYPSYIGILKNYTRAVAQRNQIIKDFRYDVSLSVMLDVFEKEIAEQGRKIISTRKKYLNSLSSFLPQIYDGISSGKEILSVEYKTVEDEALLETELLNSRKEDMFNGTTSKGPHRDDIEFKINGNSARNFGSQGQKRSVTLSLKLAEAEVIKKVTGEYPVFLLDDVMSELDPERQNYILNHIKGIQSFLTCCDPSNTKNLETGKIFEIKNGRVVN